MTVHIVNGFTDSPTADCCGATLALLDASEITLNPGAVTCGMPTSAPCACWVARVSIHDGHCCFTTYDAVSNTVTCGHDAAGMKWHEANARTVSDEHRST